MSNHYRMRDDAPSAIITSRNSELRVYEGNRVFLNDKDNFEIRFFNPLSETIGAEILFNGKQTSKSLIVIKPGQDIILDRFIGEKRKMLFETYQIDGNNDAAVKAAKQNGLVEIRFYKEKKTLQDFGNTFYTNSSTFTPSNFNSRIYNSPGVYTSSLDQSIGSMDSLGGANLTSGEVFMNYSDNYEPAEVNYKHTTRSFTSMPLKKAKKVETGRVEKGEKSDQKLDLVQIEFESYQFLSVTYQLLPISQQQTVTYSEIRNYCTQCSYRIRKSNWQFCPKCGEKI